MTRALLAGLAPYQPGPIAYRVRLAHPRYHVAALLAQAFRRGESSAVERELSALRETAVATVRYGVERLPDDALTLCMLVAEYASDRAQQLPDGDRVAVFAHAIRTLLDDAPDAYCALDRRVRNTCERRYPATDAHREVAAAIVEAVLLRLEGAR